MFLGINWLFLEIWLISEENILDLNAAFAHKNEKIVTSHPGNKQAIGSSENKNMP